MASLDCPSHRHTYQTHIADDGGIVWSGKDYTQMEPAYRQGVNEAVRFVPFPVVRPLVDKNPVLAFPQVFNLGETYAIFLEKNCQLTDRAG